MGRGVNYLTEATKVVYRDVSEFDEDGFDWEDLIYSIREDLQHRFKSFEECDRWDGNEVHIIAENSFAEVAVSEYCGLASVSCRVNYYLDVDKEGLANNWIKNLEKELEKFGNLSKVGTFSNGTSVFEKK